MVPDILEEFGDKRMGVLLRDTGILDRRATW
jgi:hypothetical protein